MESPAQRCVRIVSALEDLAAQEAAGVARKDFATVQALHERTAPLVEFLAAAGAEVLGAAGLRRRLLAVYELRARSGEILDAAMAQVRVELAQTEAGQRRAARIVPAYGAHDVRAPRLQVVG